MRYDVFVSDLILKKLLKVCIALKLINIPYGKDILFYFFLIVGINEIIYQIYTLYTTTQIPSFKKLKELPDIERSEILIVLERSESIRISQNVSKSEFLINQNRYRSESINIGFVTKNFEERNLRCIL